MHGTNAARWIVSLVVRFSLIAIGKMFSRLRSTITAPSITAIRLFLSIVKQVVEVGVRQGQRLWSGRRVGGEMNRSSTTVSTHYVRSVSASDSFVTVASVDHLENKRERYRWICWLASIKGHLIDWQKGDKFSVIERSALSPWNWRNWRNQLPWS